MYHATHTLQLFQSLASPPHNAANCLLAKLATHSALDAMLNLPHVHKLLLFLPIS
jgi:hypothetical protein